MVVFTNPGSRDHAVAAWGAFALALIGVVLVMRRGSASDSETAGAHATA